MQIFEGIIDIHAHASPDKTPRSLDVLELARAYRDRGVRGVVLMNHSDQTAGLAYLVKKQFPELEVFGGIVLNHLIGGMNQHAVEHFTRIEEGFGKIVYMPTTSSEHEVRQGENRSASFVPVSHGGKLLPEVLDMLDLIAGLGLVLSTGHSSPVEIIMLIEAARARDIQQILVTNPMYWAIAMTTGQMKEAADLGAYLEFIYYSVGRPGAIVTMQDYAAAIDTIGPGRCILSSCGGQAWLPVHAYAWSELLAGMRENGLSDEDIDRMSKTNPARLLGLE
ncbi:MAG: hypothetical protein HN712_19195 [Gemmatimonadetes bacterium]|jgi:hypothetical protein|nr:hypothetical protein [Gemmatimonadota bacterium]MBT6147097.1 hypothetical protein [Gemmatimonadota bacterium]MBT7862450.1 hypothetical protein [Gemmatimonadota bacterium]